MKKSIIAAGAASVALAAMPIVGAMAVGDNGTYTDIIQTTIDSSCSFIRNETTTDPSTDPPTTDLGHTSGIWGRSGADATIDTLSAQTLTTGSEQALGNSLFHVVCNDTDGYQVALTTHSNFLLNGSAAPLNTWAYTNAAPSGTPSASYWRIDVSGAEGTSLGAGTADQIVSTKNGVQNGIDFTVTYKAYAIANQDAGTYAANAVYTFTQL